ncbi:hypothetical protein EK21DRAFT_84106 [Setomelanomma holmii]|uniref:Uncharacterized protein n=1 Tax=Setomelanomma holmii TaxID=210430 RepID=A0A9P4HJF8_9PLEO|nr:hypothetical protein EK21DRAFT_84106 [Setomelanomma holmii]
MYVEKTSYRPLMSATTTEDDRLSKNDDVHLSQCSAWQHCLPNLILAALFILAVLVATPISLVLMWQPTDMQCIKTLSLYSPALEAIEHVDYDCPNYFNETSFYRSPPPAEREAAWARLTEKHAIEISGDKLASLNHSEADDLKHVPAEVGTGYVAAIEVFHQLHCLVH